MSADLSLYAVVIALLGASACRATGYYVGGRIEEERIPAEIRGDYAVFASNCSKCHDLARALDAHIHDVRHWDLYVARMARTAGSGINPSESPAILRFLYWHTAQLAQQKAKKP